MFLIIDEFENVSQIAELTPDIMEAIGDGVMSVFQWNDKDKCFEEHDGTEWSKCKTV